MHAAEAEARLGGEARAADGRDLLLFNRFDDCQRRWAVDEPLQEVVDGRCAAFDLDDGARAVVADRAGQAE